MSEYIHRQLQPDRNAEPAGFFMSFPEPTGDSNFTNETPSKAVNNTMNGYVSISGLWHVEASFAARMEAIARPRILAGKEPIAPGLISEHPSLAIRPILLTTGLQVMAGTISYYELAIGFVNPLSQLTTLSRPYPFF
ncbi:hypothetical protein GO755_07765 [Spirosoma sp. HMF4905]|uniref:Uncharacterized protein n=1 Tax=Spirosoma arboris TaxID=2682092 RepID=A0A7K1S7Z1_9BACT|nr:hypothetical protein [Spirosoma arboris]